MLAPKSHHRAYILSKTHTHKNTHTHTRARANTHTNIHHPHRWLTQRELVLLCPFEATIISPSCTSNHGIKHITSHHQKRHITYINMQNKVAVCRRHCVRTTGGFSSPWPAQFWADKQNEASVIPMSRSTQYWTKSTLRAAPSGLAARITELVSEMS